MSVAQTKGLKKILDKIRSHFSDAIEKMENSEAYDGSHLCAHLEEVYPTAQAKGAVCCKIDALIPLQPNLQSHVPDAAKGDVIVHITQFRWDKEMVIKAMSRWPDVLQFLEHLFPEGLWSNDEKIMVFFRQAPHAPLPRQSIQVRNGAAKVLGSWMLAIGAVELLSAAERLELKPLLETLGQIHCTWDDIRDTQASLFKAIGVKMSRSLVQRMDPDQVLSTLEPIIAEKKKKEGAPANLSDLDWFDLVVNEYNDNVANIESKIDGDTRKCAKLLTEAGPECRHVIQTIWSSKAKVAESAVTVDELAKREIGVAAFAVTATGDAAWGPSLTGSKDGLKLWLVRMRVVFNSNLAARKAQTRKGHVNLKSLSASLRTQNPSEAWALCTWWGNSEALLKAELKDKYDAVLSKFLKGTSGHATER